MRCRGDKKKPTLTCFSENSSETLLANIDAIRESIYEFYICLYVKYGNLLAVGFDGVVLQKKEEMCLVGFTMCKKNCDAYL